ncbi:toll/interleukin-1 receptor domain-containing protein [Streptomyces sp. NPDC056486]|uniref:toll/interleukin-1 receptor domain-containing protein n=1 Tax=Streptomyces sp. NPDC056486 TaxID=3345835 RepID=UPI00367B24CC
MDGRWSGKLRLDLVDALADLPGAETDTFFSAYGLSEAYDRPGRMASKKSKINSAIRAAETQGRIDLVLSAAVDRFRLTLDGYSAQSAAEFAAVPPSSNEMNSGKSIFISHASADRDLASALKDHLILGGVPNGKIFFSSENSTGIPAGQNVHHHLQQTLANSAVVIELISETFLTRPYCLMELGAAWVLNKPTYPLVVPPLSILDATRAVGNVKMRLLGTDAEADAVFDELHEMLSDVGLILPLRFWNEAVQKFNKTTRGMFQAADIGEARA